MNPALLKLIRKKHNFSPCFTDIMKTLPGKLKKFDPVNNAFAVEKVFEKGVGQVSAINLLSSAGHIDAEWLSPRYNKEGKLSKNDFQGIYAFVHGDQPFYVGISRSVISRLIQHLKGNSHHTSTLTFKICRFEHERKNGRYEGTRRQFESANDTAPTKDFLMKQKVAIMPVENEEELYLFELYCAMELGCAMNHFKTH